VNTVMNLKVRILWYTSNASMKNILTYMNLTEKNCEDVRQMELTQYLVQWHIRIPELFTTEQSVLWAWNLQCTLTMILLLTEGGTPLEAIQRYAPISDLVILESFRISPWHDDTVT
jgi:hypothetical protein